MIAMSWIKLRSRLKSSSKVSKSSKRRFRRRLSATQVSMLKVLQSPKTRSPRLKKRKLRPSDNLVSMLKVLPSLKTSNLRQKRRKLRPRSARGRRKLKARPRNKRHLRVVARLLVSFQARSRGTLRSRETPKSKMDLGVRTSTIDSWRLSESMARIGQRSRGTLVPALGLRSLHMLRLFARRPKPSRT